MRVLPKALPFTTNTAHVSDEARRRTRILNRTNSFPGKLQSCQARCCQDGAVRHDSTDSFAWPP